MNKLVTILIQTDSISLILDLFDPFINFSLLYSLDIALHSPPFHCSVSSVSALKHECSRSVDGNECHEITGLKLNRF